MKAPGFWQDRNSWRAMMLTPLGQVYRSLGRLRRACVRPYRASVPVICVGNIVAGGAGKTPTALALASLLKRGGAKPAFVSRGYGGSEKGPLRVDAKHHTFREVGDEALLLADVAPCWIGRNRAAAVRAAGTEASHIVLDDGMQNPGVLPSFTLLVIDGEVGLGNEKRLPAGPLREALEEALPRVDAVLMIGEDQHRLTERIGKQVFSATLINQLPDDFNLEPTYFAFAGIGRPEKFFASCRMAGLNLNGAKGFPDHHAFTRNEMHDLIDHARKRHLKLVTTQKDAVRLSPEFRKQVSVLPAKLLIEEEEVLHQLIETKLKTSRN